MGDKIKKVETFCLGLPYKDAVRFGARKETVGQYILLRLTTADGAVGIAESVARPTFTGEDPRSLAYQIETFFRPMIEGVDALEHNRILRRMAHIKNCRTAQALVDVALWDLKGKLLNQPVWRLLGGGPVQPVPVSWIAHGNTAGAMVDQANRMVLDRGFRGVKIKTWKRSDEDIEIVSQVRRAIGEERLIYVDANGAYTETEARTILSRLAEFKVSFIEEPCRFANIDRMALMAQSLPIAILGDQSCDSLEGVQTLAKISAVGGISVKLRRTGITESLKIIAVCEATGLPVIIGTDSKSRIGSMARLHLRAAIPHLFPWPTETHFFEKLEDDAFFGDFSFQGGLVSVPDTAGFGAGIDEKKLQKYAL